jgi:hypothetical protein
MMDYCPECHLVIPPKGARDADRALYVVPYHKSCLLKKLQGDPVLPFVLRQFSESSTAK